MSDPLTESEQRAAQLCEPATLSRTDIGYVGELHYFGLKLWLRAYRLGDDIKVEVWDGRPK